jgi:hypothetical protein
MENVEDGKTQGDYGHKNHKEISLTAWDQMITLISWELCVNFPPLRSYLYHFKMVKTISHGN